MILQNDRLSAVHALRVLQSPSYGIEECDWFVLRLDAEIAFRLIDRLNLLHTARAKDQETEEILFADDSGRFVGEVDPLGQFLASGGGDPCHLVVRPGEVLWRAHHPDWDVTLESEALSEAELLEVAGRTLVRIS